MNSSTPLLKRFNFAIRVRDFNMGTFKVEVTNSPLGRMRSPEIVHFCTDVIPYIKKLANADKEGEMSLGELIEMGKMLGDMLFPIQVRRMFLQSWEVAYHPPLQGMRILLELDDDALAMLPWEYTYIYEYGHMRMIRSPRSPQVPDLEDLKSKVEKLVHMKKTGAGLENGDLQQELEHLSHHIADHVAQPRKPTIEELRKDIDRVVRHATTEIDDNTLSQVTKQLSEQILSHAVLDESAHLVAKHNERVQAMITKALSEVEHDIVEHFALRALQVVDEDTVEDMTGMLPRQLNEIKIHDGLEQPKEPSEIEKEVKHVVMKGAEDVRRKKGFLCLDEYISFVRYESFIGVKPIQEHDEQNINLLVGLAEPIDLGDLDTETEASQILQAANLSVEEEFRRFEQIAHFDNLRNQSSRRFTEQSPDYYLEDEFRFRICPSDTG